MKITRSELKEMIRETMKEVSPKGWEGTVKSMKKHKDIDNPWALAHWMKNKGYKSHKNESINEETSDKEAASEVLDYLKSAYKLSKKYPPGKFDYDISGIRGHPADLAMTGAERYWDGRIAKVLGIRDDMRNLRTAEQPNATKLIAKILKKAERNFKKIK